MALRSHQLYINHLLQPVSGSMYVLYFSSALMVYLQVTWMLCLWSVAPIQVVGQRARTPPKTHQGPGLSPKIVHLLNLSGGLFLLHIKVVDSRSDK